MMTLVFEDRAAALAALQPHKLLGDNDALWGNTAPALHACCQGHPWWLIINGAGEAVTTLQKLVTMKIERASGSEGKCRGGTNWGLPMLVKDRVVMMWQTYSNHTPERASVQLIEVASTISVSALNANEIALITGCVHLPRGGVDPGATFPHAIVATTLMSDERSSGGSEGWRKSGAGAESWGEATAAVSYAGLGRAVDTPGACGWQTLVAVMKTEAASGKVLAGAVEGRNVLGCASLGSDIDRLGRRGYRVDGRVVSDATSRIDSLLRPPCRWSLGLLTTIHQLAGGLVTRTRADRGHGWLRQLRPTISTSCVRNVADMMRAAILEAGRFRGRRRCQRPRSQCQGMAQEVHQSAGCCRPMMPACHTSTKPTYLRRHRGRRPCMLGGPFHRRDRDRHLRAPSRSGSGIAVLGRRRCWCQVHQSVGCCRPMVPACHTPTKPTHLRRHRGRRPCMLGGLFHRRDRDRLLRGPSQNGGGIAVLECRRCWCQGAQQHRRSACTMVPSYHTPMLGGLPYRRMGSWQP